MILPILLCGWSPGRVSLPCTAVSSQLSSPAPTPCLASVLVVSITCSSEETIFIVSCSAVADTHSVIFKTTCGQPVINIYIITGVKNTFLVKIVTFMCLEETAVNSRPCPVFFLPLALAELPAKTRLTDWQTLNLVRQNRRL